MKTNRIITFLMAVVAAISVSAQKQLTIVNEDASESFEVTVPDGLKIYEYNANWLDSIPYLLEHARNHEAWAYENLGRCCRYGIGTDKCITNAMVYYDLSDNSASELAKEAYASDPTDEFGLMNHLLEELDRNRMDVQETVDLLAAFPGTLPGWAVRMKDIFENRNTEDIENYILSTIDLNGMSGDELLASMVCLMLLKPDAVLFDSKPLSPEFMEKLAAVANKIPRLYALAGGKYWSMYEDCPDNEDALRNAFDMYHKAYLSALLDMGGAVAVLDYCDENPLYDGFPFSQDELAHLDSMYPKEFRDELNEPCAIEEEVEDESVS